MKFCPNCGGALITRIGKSSWTATSLCLNEECGTLVDTIYGDMGPSSHSFRRISPESQAKLLALFNEVGENGRIPD